MRNLKFLVGALGGVFGGYLLSNKKLRKKLQEAKDPGEAAKILGKEIQQSGKQVAKEAKTWLERPDVQLKIGEWKRYLVGEGEKLKRKARQTAARASKTAKRKVAVTYKHAKRAVEKKLG